MHFFNQLDLAMSASMGRLVRNSKVRLFANFVLSALMPKLSLETKETKHGFTYSGAETRNL